MLLTVTVFGGCSDGDAPQQGASPELETKTAWITRLNGRYETDSTDGEKPVVIVKLVRTEVDDAALAELKELPGIRQLELQHTKIGDAGIEHIASLKDLQWLDLSHTEVGDAGMKHLSGLTGLKVLKLTGSRVATCGTCGSGVAAKS